MQLDEFDPTGETGNDSDGDGIPFLPQEAYHLAPVWAAEAQLDLRDRSGVDDHGNVKHRRDILRASLQPNPARNTLTISTEGLQPNVISTLSVLTASGAEVKTMQVTDKITRLNVSTLRPGTYFIKIISGDKIIHKMFVKM